MFMSITYSKGVLGSPGFEGFGMPVGHKVTKWLSKKV